VSINPYQGRYHNNLGTVYDSLELKEKSLDSFKKAVKVQPDYYLGYANLGAWHRVKGNNEEALEYYRKAISLNPGYAKAHYGLGLIYYEKGDFKAALDYIEKASELGYEADPGIISDLKSKTERLP
jgi:tetratricopeptide (TPR) repeat protein